MQQKSTHLDAVTEETLEDILHVRYYSLRYGYQLQSSEV